MRTALLSDPLSHVLCLARRLLALLLIAPLAATAAERAIDKEITIAAPVAAVWQSWTTQAGIESFFAPEAEIDARVGGAFHIHMDPLAEPGLKGADDMRFMALQPMKMLSFDWNAPPSMPEVRQQRSFVVVRLFDIDGRSTRVTLHHTGWGDGGEWDKAYGYFDIVWSTVLRNLKRRHEVAPRNWTEWMENLRKVHSPDPDAVPK